MTHDPDLDAANARLAAAPSRDVPCVTCGHSILVHQNNEAGGPCGQCDCEDGKMPCDKKPGRGCALKREDDHLLDCVLALGHEGSCEVDVVKALIATGSREQLATALRAADKSLRREQARHRDVPLDREALGRRVREVWIAWAHEQPVVKASWIVPWDELPEPDREVDRRIGEAIARDVVLGGSDRIAVAMIKETEEERDEARATVDRLRGWHGVPPPEPDARDRARGAWDAWTDEDRETECAAVAALTERAGFVSVEYTVTLATELAHRIIDLTAQVSRLTLQLSTDHLNARVAELVVACTRHETEARAAREELRMAGKLFQGEQRRHDAEEEEKNEALRAQTRRLNDADAEIARLRAVTYPTIDPLRAALQMACDLPSDTSDATLCQTVARAITERDEAMAVLRHPVTGKLRDRAEKATRERDEARERLATVEIAHDVVWAARRNRACRRIGSAGEIKVSTQRLDESIDAYDAAIRARSTP